GQPRVRCLRFVRLFRLVLRRWLRRLLFDFVFVLFERPDPSHEDLEEARSSRRPDLPARLPNEEGSFRVLADPLPFADSAHRCDKAFPRRWLALGRLDDDIEGRRGGGRDPEDLYAEGELPRGAHLEFDGARPDVLVDEEGTGAELRDDR